MSTSVVYPDGVAPALGHLYSSRNEIEVFVEDTANRNVWRNILKKFLPEGVAFTDPIPLGGRPRVLEECRRDQREDGRRKLYIIDADLDILQGTRKPNLKHLYRLRGYCVENYLIQESALVKVAQILDPDVSEEDARNRLDFSSWKERNQEPFKQLFVCYATVNRIDERHQTVGHWIGHVSRPAPLFEDLCPQKTNRRCRELIRLVRADFPKAEVRATYDAVLQRAKSKDFMIYVSGKDGLLNRLILRLKRLFGRMDDDQIKVLLASYMSPDIDPYLQRRIRQICA